MQICPGYGATIWRKNKYIFNPFNTQVLMQFLITFIMNMVYVRVHFYIATCDFGSLSPLSDG